MELFLGENPTASGSLFVGSRGTLYSPGDNGNVHRLLPLDRFGDYQPPAHSLPRSTGHHAEWIRACKGGPAAMSNFDYAGPLTEMALLGNVAIRTGERVTWDTINMRATPALAQRYIRRDYRQGWAL
jgi:hypothetical protein